MEKSVSSVLSLMTGTSKLLQQQLQTLTHLFNLASFSISCLQSRLKTWTRVVKRQTHSSWKNPEGISDMPEEEGNPLFYCCCFLWSVSKGRCPVDKESQGPWGGLPPFLTRGLCLSWQPASGPGHCQASEPLFLVSVLAPLALWEHC